MLETSRCISIFAQIVATVPFYTRAYFDMGQYSINKSTIGRKWWKSDKKDPNMKIETGVIRFYLEPDNFDLVELVGVASRLRRGPP